MFFWTWLCGDLVRVFSDDYPQTRSSYFSSWQQIWIWVLGPQRLCASNPRADGKRPEMTRRRILLAGAKDAWVDAAKLE